MQRGWGRAQLCVCAHDGAREMLCMGSGNCRHDGEEGVAMAMHALLAAKYMTRGLMLWCGGPGRG